MRSVVDRNVVTRRVIVVSVLSVTDSVHAMTSDGGGGRETCNGNESERCVRQHCQLVFILLIVTVMRNAKDRGTDDPQTCRKSGKEKIKRPTPVTTGQP